MSNISHWISHIDLKASVLIVVIQELFLNKLLFQLMFCPIYHILQAEDELHEGTRLLNGQQKQQDDTEVWILFFALNIFQYLVLQHSALCRITNKCTEYIAIRLSLLHTHWLKCVAIPYEHQWAMQMPNAQQRSVNMDGEYMYCL